MLSATSSSLTRITGLFATALLIALGNGHGVQAVERLVTYEQAARHGLQRAWFAQVRVDRTRNRVTRWVLHNGTLFAVTSSGTVQALDAETGANLWVTQVGSGEHPTEGPAANDSYVAFVSGLQLYILSRDDGHLLWTERVEGAVSAAPTLSSNYAFVAHFTGRIEGFSLDQPASPPWQYQSAGRTFLSPTVTDSVVCWPTNTGFLYVAQADNPRILFRVETNDEIASTPATKSPYLYVTSLDGYLYCVHELTGFERWKYSTGFPITSKPAIVGEQAFVASEGPMLHAVDAATGKPLWIVEGVQDFVAVGENHTYGMDRFGSLLVLDKASGRIAGRLSAGTEVTTIANDQTDRIYLVSERGLVQCLREVGADQPTFYRKADDNEETTEEVDRDEDNLFLVEGEDATPTVEEPALSEEIENSLEDVDDETEPSDDTPFFQF